MPSSMRDPWFVTGVLANLALGVVLAGLVLAPMYMALRWWIAHQLRQPRGKPPLDGSEPAAPALIFRKGIHVSAREMRSRLSCLSRWDGYREMGGRVRIRNQRSSY